MALVIKKKEPVVQNDQLTEREEDTLVAVGILPPKKTGLIVKRKNSFSVGSRIRIRNDLFSWIESYKHGDMGTVVKMYSPPLEAKGDKKYGLLEVKLDTTRMELKPVVLIRFWEAELVE